MEKYRFDEQTMSVFERSCIPFAIYQFIDRRVVTLALSDGFLELFGFEEREDALWVMDNDMYRDAHPEDASRIADAAFRFATEGGRYDVVYRTRAPGGSDYTIVHAHGKHVHAPDGTRLAVVWYTDEGATAACHTDFMDALNDTLNRLLHEETLLQGSRYDPLTGMPNMRYFFELAQAGRARIRAAGGVTAILFFDFARMKVFNRKYGFAEGNNLIRAVGKVLVSYFSNENCGRVGQDHFAVYAPLEGLEDKLREIFAICRVVNDGKNLPIRVGIYRDDFEDVEIPIALDRAKMVCDLNRKAYISVYDYFDSGMLEGASRRNYVLENLDRALEEHWISVYYQPIVRASNGKVCDEEALARWTDPERGVLPPADFIPHLEDTRLIYKLDLYMVEEVLRHMRRKEAAGLPVISVSVNLSRSDFDACDIVEEIRRRVDEAGIPREKLNIEITESVIGKNYEFIRKQIERFHELGFQVWMDDFGSGYSSLEVLQSFHFDLIKFDMQFMRQYDTSEKSRIILTELMKMAVRLGIDTVTEGVENRDQLRFLRSIGCDKIQGFLYSSPKPLDVIMSRYLKGESLDLEDPRESDYYTAIGTLNLDDPAVVDTRGESSPNVLRPFYNAVPMAVLESGDAGIRILRCNRAYVDFLRRNLQINLPDEQIFDLLLPEQPGKNFMANVQRCRESEDWVSLSEKIRDGFAVNAFARRLNVNPVTGAMAMAVVVLAMLK